MTEERQNKTSNRRVQACIFGAPGIISSRIAGRWIPHFLFLLFGLCILLSLPASANAERKGHDIVLWHSFRGKEEKALAVCAGAYNLEHDDQIVLKAFEGDTLTTEVEKAIKSGAGPDIFIWAHDRIGGWVKSGIIAPINIGNADSALLQVYLPNCIQALFYKRALYGLPMSFETIILFYNKALVPKPPLTTDEMIRIGKILTDKNKGIYGLVYERANFYHHALWFHGFGGTLFDENQVFRPSSSAMLRSMEFARDLASVHGIIPDTVDWNVEMGLFNSGHAGMLLNGPWALGSITLDRVNLGMEVLPFITEAGEQDHPAAPFLGVKGIYMSSRCRHKESAFSAMQFLTSAYAASVMNIIGGYLPANRLAYQNRIVAADPVTAKFKEQALTSVPMPAFPEMNYVWKVMMKDNARRTIGALDRVFAGTTPLEAAMIARDDFRRLGGRAQ